MSNRLSSFPADSFGTRERRSAWPWLLAAGPALVVLASLATAWLALSRNDTVVADDYYKLGLAINRKLAAHPAVVPQPMATLNIAGSGQVRVRLDESTPPPARLRLSVLRPGEVGGPNALLLTRASDHEWTGVLAEAGGERRIVTLESEAWRLPVTVVGRLPATIVLRSDTKR
jgi:uncharacterized protein